MIYTVYTIYTICSILGEHTKDKRIFARRLGVCPCEYARTKWRHRWAMANETDKPLSGILRMCPGLALGAPMELARRC